MDDDGRPAGTVLPLTPAPDGVELRHLRSFVAVAEELNFSRAAARLYLSQPALSRQVRSLERLIGCDLLRRSTHRVELTIAGEALLERAHRLLHDVDDAIVATQAVGDEIEGRLARIWEPILDISPAGGGLQTLRNAAEDLHGQFTVPDVEVRPVNAGGVHSLLVSPPGTPVSLLYLHGGGYVLGSAFGYRHLAGALGLAAGAGALVPEYRLAPEHPFPAALEDALRAYRWLVESGTPPEQVVVAGDSAGAALAMAVVQMLRAEGEALPGALVLLCPGLRLTYPEMAGGAVHPGITAEQMRYFAEAYLAGHPEDDPLVAPLEADLTGFPPLLVQGGTGDLIVADAHRVTENARRHGVDVTLELYPVDTHDFQVFWSFLPEAADAVRRAGAFIRQAHEAAGVATRRDAR
jgi:monoterpene epsilon-lactone hydrolase